ncbi:glycosyltransferase family 4 protein [Yoonia sp. MH D7]
MRAVFVGSVEPRKGPQDLVQAVNALDGAVHLDVFGNLSNANPQKLTSPHITLHGKQPFPRIAQAYHNADVFVLPSYLEGSATVVYEAMSYGLPCIVTYETGSVIRDGIDGFIVPSGDINALTSRLHHLASDPALCAEMGKSALTRAADFTLAKYGDRLCSAISKG